ncbi:MAG: hypothetical protein GQ540_04715 [Lutibacter sp.]|nr:hypothetical protein [Lutibacter sp.]NOR27814.1 hypothetical protein [Lutibacter sp.]
MCTYICSVNKQQYLKHSIMKKVIKLSEKLNSILRELGTAASFSIHR